MWDNVSYFTVFQQRRKALRLPCMQCFISGAYKILPSYTCANTDLSNRLLEMWIQFLDDLWLLWGLMSRYTLLYIHLCMTRWAARIPVPWGAWAPWTETEKPRRCWFLKEEMTPHIIFQIKNCWCSDPWPPICQNECPFHGFQKVQFIRIKACNHSW